MISSLDNYFANNVAALKLRGMRQEVLASNIANGDTPNYKARDFDFSAAFAQAIGNSSQNASLGLATTNSRHISMGSGAAQTDIPLLYRNDLQPSIDGNTVDMNVEMASFSDNALRMQAELVFTSQAISGYKAALQNQ